MIIIYFINLKLINDDDNSKEKDNKKYYYKIKIYYFNNYSVFAKLIINLNKLFFIEFD